jgi:hypothetical protein
MADTKKDFLKDASGLEKQKLRNKLEGTKANKPLLDEEKVTAFRDKLRNPGKYAGADYSPDPYSSGTIKGASDMATAIEKEKEYNDAMNMVAKDKKFVDKKKGGKITAANYDKEYGKIYRKAVKKMASGGSVGSASKRADGIAVKGKTRGKIC